MKKILLLNLAFIFLQAAAQGRLPDCGTTGQKIWTQCVGSFSFPNGNNYFGEFKDGNFDGSGELTFTDGRKYVGEFKAGKYSGQGVFSFSDGRKHFGYWTEGVPDGQFVMLRSDSSVEQSGVFKAGKISESKPIDPKIFNRIERIDLGLPGIARDANMEVYGSTGLPTGAPDQLSKLRLESGQKPSQDLLGTNTVGLTALVIGNANYKSSPLKNPVNDAKDVAQTLSGLGFEVILETDVEARDIGRTLRKFKSKIKPGGIALVFYAGHGLQIGGMNYLPAVDAEIVGEEDVPYQSLSTRQIMELLAESKSSMNLIFLDACRDNPYARSFRSSSRGLSKENAPTGTLISYATRPGSVAADGDGDNGLYTSMLLKAMEEKNIPIEQLLKKVVRGVTSASNGAQEPWMEGSILGDFCFGGCTQAAPVEEQSIATDIKSDPTSSIQLTPSTEVRDKQNLTELISASRSPIEIDELVTRLGASPKDYLFGLERAWSLVGTTNQHRHYVDSNVESKEAFFVFPSTRRALANGRVTLDVEGVLNKKVLIFNQQNITGHGLVFDCIKKEFGFYLLSQVEPKGETKQLADPELMPLQGFDKGSVLAELFEMACSPRGFALINLEVKNTPDYWRFVFQDSSGGEVFMSNDASIQNGFVRAYGRTIHKTNQKIPTADINYQNSLFRYTVDCTNKLVASDSEYRDVENNLLAKTNAFGQKFFPILDSTVAAFIHTKWCVK